MKDPTPDPSPTYRHTQNANTTLLVGLTALFGITLALVALGPHPALFATGLLVALLLLLTHSLTVTVDEATIELRLGNGLLRRRIDLANVETCESFQVEGAFGLPLRRTPDGWIYAVASGEAVLLRLRDDTTCVVGSDDAVGLHLAIRRHMTLPPGEPS
jgi:hypothetical protein